MCGIIGVTGASNTLEILLGGLERLEYRGYDSAGIAMIEHDEIYRVRVADGTHSVATLRKETIDAPISAAAGIGHTRWATHGQPNEANAHPHLDCAGRIALIHNGIIENYLEIAETLIAKGHTLTSTTDTEVLAHLIEDLMAESGGLTQAVRLALEAVRGAFAIGVVSMDDPELIVAARRISPLIVGTSGDASFIASDIPALLEHTRDLMVIEDDEIVELRPGSIVVTDLSGGQVTPRPLHVDWDIEAAQKDGYDDFMTKEIHEQPRAIADTLRGRIEPSGRIVLDQLDLDDDELRALRSVTIVACGSSYHAAMVAKYAIERWARLPVDVDIASEFRYRDPVLDEHSLVIGVSQSGETIDTLQAMRQAKASAAKVVVVSNVVDSSMAREADGVLYTRAGPEVGVAATKTVLAQIVALELLGLHLAQVRSTLAADEVRGIVDGLFDLEHIVAETIDRDADVAKVARELVGAHDFFFLGRQASFPTALEGALKLKEISYLHAEGYAGGELKHGPLAVIEPGCIVVAVATGDEMKEKILSNVAEVKSRGATVVLLAEDGDDHAAGLADFLLLVPASLPLLSPVKDIVPLQQLAYHLARNRGLDVDRPRNLAKTVTVE
jgi:glucosamine--fructose-6-phosphate aminotransferase (isomerizing)